MTAMTITAWTAVSALGRGGRAHLASVRERRSGLRPNDFDPALGGWIGRVAGVEDHRLPAEYRAWDCRNNRLAHMALREDGFEHAVAAARARYGAHRVGLVVGTSTSGILSAEEAYRVRGEDGALPDTFDYARTQDLGSLSRFVRAALRLEGPAFTISVACASSARAFMDAANLIRAGLCDAAVVGGADSLCRMTLHGFQALELIAPVPCRPCDAERPGISIGEAAGFALLEPDGRGIALLGAGASSDGHHMSSPLPGGEGAASAMADALHAAGRAPESVDWINLHGTGTRANDAMEDLAVASLFGNRVPCSSTKGWTGHTLGACGVLETVIAAECMQAGLVAGCLGVERVDPTFKARVATENINKRVDCVVSNSFGFGGINCSLVLGRTP